MTRIGTQIQDIEVNFNVSQVSLKNVTVNCAHLEDRAEASIAHFLSQVEVVGSLSNCFIRYDFCLLAGSAQYLCWCNTTVNSISMAN